MCRLPCSLLTYHFLLDLHSSPVQHCSTACPAPPYYEYGNSLSEHSRGTFQERHVLWGKSKATQYLALLLLLMLLLAHVAVVLSPPPAAGVG